MVVAVLLHLRLVSDRAAVLNHHPLSWEAPLFSFALQRAQNNDRIRHLHFPMNFRQTHVVSCRCSSLKLGQIKNENTRVYPPFTFGFFLVHVLIVNSIRIPRNLAFR